MAAPRTTWRLKSRSDLRVLEATRLTWTQMRWGALIILIRPKVLFVFFQQVPQRFLAPRERVFSTRNEKDSLRTTLAPVLSGIFCKIIHKFPASSISNVTETNTCTLGTIVDTLRTRGDCVHYNSWSKMFSRKARASPRNSSSPLQTWPWPQSGPDRSGPPHTAPGADQMY